MLRGKPVSNPAAIPEAGAWPGGESPFGVADRTAGLRFYRAKASFFRPYALLRGLALTEGKLTFTFADDEVIVQGRGLHGVYVVAAEQRLAWVCAQGERGAAGEAPVAVASIDLVPLRDSEASAA